MLGEKWGAGSRKPVVIAAGMVSLLWLLSWGVERGLEYKARRVIEKKATQSGIRLEIGDIRVGLLNRSLQVDRLSLQTDNGAVLLGDSSLRSVELNLDRLALRGVWYRDRHGHKSLSLRSVSLRAPHVVLHRWVDSLERLPRSKQDPLPVGKPKADWMSGLSIGQLQIEDGYVEYHLHQGSDFASYRFEGLQVQARRIVPDSLSGEDVQMALARVSYRFNNDAFRLQADTLTLNSESGTLSIASIHLIPQYAKLQFAFEAPGHADWTQFASGPLHVSGLSLRHRQGRPLIHADSLSLDGFTFDSYKNRYVPQAKRIKPLFFESLQRLPFGLSLDWASLRNGRATYEELPPTGVSTGSITFGELNAELSGLTNLPQPDRSFYRLSAWGRLMDTADLKADFLFPVDSLTDYFEVTGHLGSMPMALLNPALDPWAGAEIQKGEIRSLDFHIQGTTRRSTVSLTLLYDGLWVELIKNKRGKIRERKLLSFLADDFLIRTSNPDGHGLHRGKGSWVRDPYHSQFNYLWKSLWPGLKTTLL